MPRTVPAVDVHAHLGVPAVDELIADEPGLARQRAIDGASLGPESAACNAEQIGALAAKLTDVDLRIAAMDRAGVDVQAVSPVPLPHTWAPRELATRIAALTNEAVAEFCARRPDRFVGIGAVSLQHPDLAARQLRTAVRERGIRGVQISTVAAPGIELDHPSLAEFWAAAEELDAAVLIHPWGCTLGERLNAYYLFNTVGNPVETALALSRLAFSGLLERHPRLRIWSAHGGGYLGSHLVRADHAWSVRGDARTTEAPPSELLRRTFVDSLVYTPHQLRHLVETMGAGSVTLGSDYPFDMGVEDPVDRLLAAGLDVETSEAIRGRNAERLLGPLPGR
ncbi:amidohydrolase family protein [Saccharopolyspora dendranthemae]|uniref:Aminocarboxymuconate-semialdehyde decarboxylase n=1 Tax=Saccharopolyspora dendranthemae TaxID=1181886 RepID=A0A561U815_9PSEU|nr:amidohydrolase family protein [Saccharopolyspora dendranthemae]TWF95506.1 aminocarboxymuconate-semialdehyde decarboxylase [Saccharopolyspora dendranthemae]